MEQCDEFIADIAVIGMSGRFPGARTLDQFWRNLSQGVESITRFSDDDLLSNGVDPALLNNSDYIKAGGILEDVALFDAAFFGITPQEAEVMDPQHRIFLECAWEALESAGYAVDPAPDAVAVYAGASANTYFLVNLYEHRALLRSAALQAELGSRSDFLTTRVSYKLNLRGPSLNVQTASSTALAAVHLACQSLLAHESDIALAGGVSLTFPQVKGYFYQLGRAESPDGHCRAFDATAQGSVEGQGVGVVVLKRLADALRDRDSIHAVIKGSAINNDGAYKVGYTTPSIVGQKAVIKEALAVAGVEPDSVTFIETHGTGTPLGDAIEFRALAQVFTEYTTRRNYCALGAVKNNIGHLNVAAGIAGLIKTILALKHKQIPPTLHFEQPNPHIDLAASPFFINTELIDWPAGALRRRAGVSAFGLGGTNVHVILEEAPQLESHTSRRPWHLLTLSTQTATALETASAQLADHLVRFPDLDLGDVAHTLQRGRRTFGYRRIAVCRDRADAVALLTQRDQEYAISGVPESLGRPVVLLLPGSGDDYEQMAAALYRDEPAFGVIVDQGVNLLARRLEIDPHALLPGAPAAAREPQQASASSLGTRLGHFITTYALARLLQQWGIQPKALIGDRDGEYVAACLAGVFTLEDALVLVAEEARLLQSLPVRSALAVMLPEQAVQSMVRDDVALAAVYAPELCVVAGPPAAIAQAEHMLTARGVACRQVPADNGLYEPIGKTIAGAYTKLCCKLTLRPPELPLLSNLTGIWLTAQQATDPRYWSQRICQTARLDRGIREVVDDPGCAMLVVGPAQARCISALNRLDETRPTTHPVVTLLWNTDQEAAQVLAAVGRLWLAGIAVDWSAQYEHEPRRFVPLPTYPFERQRYWVAPAHHPDAESR